MSARAQLQELRRHRVPAWWTDAKLGVFVHWTPASVAGWAPVDSEIGDLLAAGDPAALAETPYTEWYENSLRFPDSSVARYHRDTYGSRPYAEFAADYEAGLDDWDPDDWAERFRAAGARYVVLVAKHHDGFCLWPTSVANPNRAFWHTRRDVVGELREAVLGAGMRFGLYYSGGLDWTFDDRPLGNLGDLLASVPRGAYPAYAEAHVRELVQRYRPSVLWNDIAWPSTGAGLWPLMADYYATVPDGVINDRWMPWSPAMGAARAAPVRRVVDTANARMTRRSGGLVPPRPPHFDVQTPEYVVFDDVRRRPWECVRGMDQSFGYNRNSRPEHFLSPSDLVEMLADIVSKGGNLLLNVGPRGEDASIPDVQADLLAHLGRWTSGPGSAVYASRPWVRATATAAEGVDLRFWASDRSVWAAAQGAVGDHLTVPGIGATPTTAAWAVDPTGGRRPLEWAAAGTGLRLGIDAQRDHPVVQLDDVTAGPI
jgi:alpha-L-fucosidase